LKIQRKFPILEKMCPVKAAVITRLDDLPDNAGDELQLFRRSIISHPKGKYHPAFMHSLVISDSSGEQSIIGADDLLARQAADAGGLDPDTFHRAHEIIEDNKVSNDKWLVQNYGNSGKQIT